MSDNIPFEIQVEIMKRLPTKSLIQFRSVSKPWKSLIDSPEFIADYHTHHHHHNHLLVRYDDNSDDLKYVSILDNDNDSFPQHKFPLTVPESVKLIIKPKLVGSSHGLFCFYNFYGNTLFDDAVSNTVVVWNPSIRKSVDIDVYEISSWLCETVIGFGVCPHTLHFKLLKVSFIRLASQIEYISDIPYQVEVFTGGGWRSPLCMNNLPRKSIAFERDQVEIDGFIYWHAQDRTPVDDPEVWFIAGFDYRDLIMSFDMTSEEFTEIYLPDGLKCSGSSDLFISKLKESLVVLECNMVAEKQVYGVWKMEHGISKTFTKLYTIGTPEASIERVLGFRNSGEPIVGAYIDSKGCSEQIAIFVYEPDSKHINNVGISGKRVSFFASSYVETLLLFDH